MAIADDFLEEKAHESNMEFEWNPDKARINLEKHEVSFEAASTVFADPLSMTFPDPIIQLGKVATLS